MFSFVKFILLSLSCAVAKPAPLFTSHLPVVVMHGLDSSSLNMEPFSSWIAAEFNTKVFNLEIGNGEKTSLYMPMTDQLGELCATIYATEELRDGFNFIGMSQGGLLARGYVERCNLSPVVNLITLVSPHGGEYLKTINTDMYSSFAQAHLSIAGYWRNPREMPAYLTKCSYLPLLNNEKENKGSQAQKKQMQSLANFVMVWSPADAVLSPPESGKFSFFDENLNVISLEDTEIYEADLLGLKYLNDQARLHTYQTNCSHVDHRNPICYSQLYDILKNFLD